MEPVSVCFSVIPVILGSAQLLLGRRMLKAAERSTEAAEQAAAIARSALQRTAEFSIEQDLSGNLLRYLGDETIRFELLSRDLPGAVSLTPPRSELDPGEAIRFSVTHTSSTDHPPQLWVKVWRGSHQFEIAVPWRTQSS
ncbi:hypothetical protein AB0I66_05500 [Streptomyces sp. NPDC050439]|uniref:hypothetical protein n=1 Tax=unclassified Streptomyces TaxID=2593676 RepID=UPI003413F401